MVKRLITFLILLIALTALTLLITLIPEILGSEITSEKGKDFLFVVLGENYSWWLLLILVAAIAVLFFFTPDYLKDIFKRQEKPITLSPEETRKNYETIRQYLCKRYDRRKDQKLAGDQLFNLRIKQSYEGTSPEKAATFLTLQGKKTGAEIQQIFEKARRRLLVTGLPGAGKTSLLLNLALELLETDPDHLVALLNLATWRSDFPSFDDWLREILPAELGVTKRYAAEILQKGQLTLLLDGLDEVAEEHRASCLKAIGEYGRLGRDYVISTRKDEYKALEKDAPVWAQIEVLPLTDKQLLAQLDKADRRGFPEAPDLKAALEHDPLLLKVAETPFYLNCLQLLFRGGATLSELNLYSDPEIQKQKELFESIENGDLYKNLPVSRFVESGKIKTIVGGEIAKRLIEQQLSKASEQGYSKEQTSYWLSFLASRMTQRNRVVFELVDLQYDWWRWNFRNLFATWFAYSSIICSFIIVIFKIPLHNQLCLFPDLVSIFTGSSIVGFGMGIINQAPNIYSVENIQWKSITIKIQRDLGEILLSFFVVFNTAGMFFLLKFGLIRGAIYSLFFYSIAIIIFVEKRTSPFLQPTTPYQRFTASAKALHFSILQHWLLRWQLYRAGVLPLRLVDFLNEMTTRHLLETDGATWRFRHRILQEYFAAQAHSMQPEKRHQ